MGLLKPNQVLNKAYRQVAIETTDFDLFKNALRTLRDNIVDGQREHTQKEHLRNFLSETFYKPYYMAPEEDIDLSVAVLIDGDNASSEKMEDVMRFVSRMVLPL